MPSRRWRLFIAALVPLLFLLAYFMPAHGSSITQGTTVTAGPPYVELGTTFYSQSWYAVTKPSSSPSWINSVAPSVTAGANGDVVLTSTSGGPFFAEVSGSASAEAEFTCHVTQTAGAGYCGLWAYDSTSSKIYSMVFNPVASGATGVVDI